MSIFRDISYIEHIIYHCQRLEDIRKRFGDSLEHLKADVDFKDLAIQQITQIGENIVSLSDNFKHEYGKIPWREIKKFRDTVTHQYKTLDLNILFSTITISIPILKKILRGTANDNYDSQSFGRNKAKTATPPVILLVSNVCVFVFGTTRSTSETSCCFLTEPSVPHEKMGEGRTKGKARQHFFEGLVENNKSQI